MIQCRSFEYQQRKNTRKIQTTIHGMAAESSGLQNSLVCLRHGKFESHCTGGKPVAVSSSQIFVLENFLSRV
jgi:hypothetical protein